MMRFDAYFGAAEAFEDKVDSASRYVRNLYMARCEDRLLRAVIKIEGGMPIKEKWAQHGRRVTRNGEPGECYYWKDQFLFRIFFDWESGCIRFDDCDLEKLRRPYEKDNDKQ